MNAVLGQLSIAIGGMLFVVVLIITLGRGVPIMVAVFRASIVMCLSSLVVGVFFRFLSAILRRFVMEQIRQQNRARAAKRQSKFNKPAIGDRASPNR